MSICDRLRCFLVVLGLMAGVIAEDVYVVPAEAQPVAFRFPAVVDLDRGKAAMLLPTCRDLVAVAVVMPGAAVEVGDVLIAFASEISRIRARAGLLTMVEAEGEAIRREQELVRDHQGLLSEQAALEQDLLVAEANLAAARAVDSQRLQVLSAEVELATDELAASRRAFELAQVRSSAGTLEVDALRAVQRQVDRAADALCAKQAERERAAVAADALTVQRQAARVDALRAKLGVKSDATIDPAAGIRGRIAAQEANQKRERRQASDKRDEVQRDLHTQERDGWDHTPVQSITIAGPKALSVVFAPPGTAIPAPALGAGIEAFDAERGWGWTAGAPRVFARSGRQPGPTLALVRGLATWSVSVPDGSYTVAITLGDNVDWDGAVVHLAGGGAIHGIFAARRLDPRKTVTANGTITVTGGRLDVIFGDATGKALRAPVAGTALPREFIVAGWKPGWMQDPAAFVAGPEALRLRARVHQTLANLLVLPGAPMEAAADPVTRLRAALAVSSVSFTSASGLRGQAQVMGVSTRPEPLSLRSDDDPQNSLDRIGNEALLALTPADAARLHLGEEVMITATLTSPSGTTVLPAHMVAVSGDRCHVQEVGAAARAVDGLRVGDDWIVAEVIAPGTHLVPPRIDVDAAGPRSVPGEVVAGTAVQIVATQAGGRIATLIEEGSEVKLGQVVATLYNPWMEERREQSDRQKAKARESYSNAAESRRVANERAAAAQREQAASEAVARVDVGLARLDEPLSLLLAEQAAASARQAADDATATLSRAEAQAAVDPLRLPGARSAAAHALLVARQADLQLVKSQRNTDWFAILSAEGAWRDAAAEVAGREADLQLARADEKVSALQAELRLQQAMQGNRWEQSFLKGREIKAPSAGRIFYRNSWDERTNRDAKFERDFWLWRGMTLADVLDMDHLAFTADVPEDAFAHVRAGAAVELVFSQFNHRRIAGTIRELGRALLVPRDGDDQADATTSVTHRRLITVTVDFAPPADLRERMVPGTKGTLVLP